MLGDRHSLLSNTHTFVRGAQLPRHSHSTRYPPHSHGTRPHTLRRRRTPGRSSEFRKRTAPSCCIRPAAQSGRSPGAGLPRTVRVTPPVRSLPSVPCRRSAFIADRTGIRRLRLAGKGISGPDLRRGPQNSGGNPARNATSALGSRTTVSISVTEILTFWGRDLSNWAGCRRPRSRPVRNDLSKKTGGCFWQRNHSEQPSTPGKTPEKCVKDPTRGCVAATSCSEMKRLSFSAKPRDSNLAKVDSKTCPRWRPAGHDGAPCFKAGGGNSALVFRQTPVRGCGEFLELFLGHRLEHLARGALQLIRRDFPPPGGKRHACGSLLGLRSFWHPVSSSGSDRTRTQPSRFFTNAPAAAKSICPV